MKLQSSTEILDNPKPVVTSSDDDLESVATPGDGYELLETYSFTQVTTINYIEIKIEKTLL